MLIANFIIITMVYGFIMVGLKDSISPIKNRLKIMFQLDKKTHDGDLHQQRRAFCWTNAPLTSPTKS